MDSRTSEYVVCDPVYPARIEKVPTTHVEPANETKVSTNLQGLIKVRIGQNCRIV